MICWHKWGLWEKQDRRRIESKTVDITIYAYSMVQERRCEKCGKYQIKHMYWSE